MRRGWLCFGICLVAGPGAVAFAQEDGVFADPESPSGKEYAIPLDEARREAGGGSGSAPGTAAPFGEGITPEDGEVPAGGEGGGENTGGSGDRDGREAGGGGSPSPTPPGGSPRVAGVVEGGGPSAGLLTGGIALGVLLLGATIGLVVRRTSR